MRIRGRPSPPKLPLRNRYAGSRGPPCACQSGHLHRRADGGRGLQDVGRGWQLRRRSPWPAPRARTSRPDHGTAFLAHGDGLGRGRSLGVAGAVMQALLRNPWLARMCWASRRAPRSPWSSRRGWGLRASAGRWARPPAPLRPSRGRGARRFWARLGRLGWSISWRSAAAWSSPCNWCSPASSSALSAGAGILLIQHLSGGLAMASSRVLIGELSDDWDWPPWAFSQVSRFSRVSSRRILVRPWTRQPRLGDDEAVSVRCALGPLRATLFVLTGVLTAARVVTLAGPVGFVGLVSPHLARLSAGMRGGHRVLVVLSWLAGGAIVVGRRCGHQGEFTSARDACLWAS